MRGCLCGGPRRHLGRLPSGVLLQVATRIALRFRLNLTKFLMALLPDWTGSDPSQLAGLTRYEQSAWPHPWTP